MRVFEVSRDPGWQLVPLVMPLISLISENLQGTEGWPYL